MASMSMKQLAAKMRGIDVTMLSTVTGRGQVAARPLSNNGEVEYDGTSYYHTWADSRLAKDIAGDAKVGLAFQGKDIFVAVQGIADLLVDKALLAEHWNDSMNAWFEDGVDTEGIVMIRVEATRIAWWAGRDSGEIVR